MVSSSVLTLGEIDAALQRVMEVMAADGNALDLAYGQVHRPRFRRNLARVAALCPRGSRILDIGSHYLHQAMALRFLGYEVVGTDVAAFADHPLIRRRVATLGIDNRVVEHLERGDFLSGEENAFDLVLFSEIFEHITFNPVRFWRRVAELLKVGGAIYITTPNSMTPTKVRRGLKQLILLRGAGLDIPSIFGHVTYGHHWKEYSAQEMREYFARLSPDFQVEVNYYAYRPVEPRRCSVKALAGRLVQAAVPAMRDELDVVVRVTGRQGWLAEAPEFL